MNTLSDVFNPMSGREIDALALQYIMRFQPEVLSGKTSFDIERFAEHELEDLTGMTIHYSSELPPEIYGLTDTMENMVKIQAALSDDPLQERFLRSTMAHETGHCILHVPLLRNAKAEKIFRQGKKDNGKINLYRKGDIPVYKNPEWQAWRFAGALLIPKKPLEILIKSGADSRTIADTFKVHNRFLEARIKALGLIK